MGFPARAAALPSTQRVVNTAELFVPRLGLDLSMDGRMDTGQRAGVAEAVAKRNASNVFGWRAGRPTGAQQREREWVKTTVEHGWGSRAAAGGQGVHGNSIGGAATTARVQRGEYGHPATPNYDTLSGAQTGRYQRGDVAGFDSFVRPPPK
jgi:hypothetical protein